MHKRTPAPTITPPTATPTSPPPPPLARNPEKQEHHIIVEEREQDWTWKQSILRRLKAPDAVVLLGVLATMVILVGGSMWAVTYLASRPVEIGVDGMIDCGAASDGNLQFDGHQINLSERNISRD